MRQAKYHLKAELHAHAGEDKAHDLDYSAIELIDHAASLGYDVLALTFHDKVFDGKAFEKASRHAKRKGVLLIPGCEATIEGKHTLIYNIKDSERRKIRSFSDLRKWRRNAQAQGREVMIIAPHPYFKSPFFGKFCLGRKLRENIDLFDAIEYSFFYTRLVNRNRKARRIAKKYDKPMVGNSDVHLLDNMGKTYSLIRARKDVDDVIRAIKDHHVEIVSRPLTVKHIAKLAIFHSIKRK